jgi:hypothetical protein
MAAWTTTAKSPAIRSASSDFVIVVRSSPVAVPVEPGPLSKDRSPFCRNLFLFVMPISPIDDALMKWAGGGFFGSMSIPLVPLGKGTRPGTCRAGKGFLGHVKAAEAPKAFSATVRFVEPLFSQQRRLKEACSAAVLSPLFCISFHCYLMLMDSSSKRHHLPKFCEPCFTSSF